MSLEETYFWNQLCLNSILLLLWIIVFVMLVYQLCYKENQIPNTTKIPTFLFIISGIFSWISWTFFMISQQFNIMISSLLIHIIMENIFYYLSFYLFILSRLKVSFHGSVHEVSNKFFIFMISLAVISLLLRTGSYLYYSISYDNISKVDLFIINVCYYQYLAVDIFIRISVIYLFNKKLFDLIIKQREDLTQFDDKESMITAISSELNNRQTVLLRSITKHTLLICIVILSNISYDAWLEIQSLHTHDYVNIGDLITDYFFFGMIVLQLICVYLEFTFANKWYNKCCGYKHVLCQQCCRKIALRKVHIDTTKEYFNLSLQNVHDQYE
eukprot:195537_1